MARPAFWGSVVLAACAHGSVGAVTAGLTLPAPTQSKACHYRSHTTGVKVGTCQIANASVKHHTANWPTWQDFAQAFIQADGRVIDFSTPQQPSTSEGQSYAMFFALAANDQAQFDRLWRWSIDNLAGGDISARLPAWQWGLRSDGTWGVIDNNSASDADLWFTYALLEAARLWNIPQYASDAAHLMRNMATSVVVSLPGLGPTLLPGSQGFALENGLWRLNPSYSVIPQLRRLALADPDGPWNAVIDSSVRMLQATTPQGFAPDWVGYQAQTDGKTGVFVTDPVQGDTGSYDAIRVYLWAAMMPVEDPLRATIMDRLHGMKRVLASTNNAPEKIATLSGRTSGNATFGLISALLPMAQANRRPATYRALLEQVQSQLKTQHAQTSADQRTAIPQPVTLTYYDWVLALFGTGWVQRQFQFLPSGIAQFSWEKTCPCDTAVQ